MMKRQLTVAVYLAIALGMMRRILRKARASKASELSPEDILLDRLNRDVRRMEVQLAEGKWLLIATCEPYVTLEQQSEFSREIASILGIDAEEILTRPECLLDETREIRSLSDAQKLFTGESDIVKAYRRGKELTKLKAYRGITVA